MLKDVDCCHALDKGFPAALVDLLGRHLLLPISAPDQHMNIWLLLPMPFQL